MQRFEGTPRTRPAPTREQVARRLLRELSAEFVALGGSGTWVVISAERPEDIDGAAQLAADATGGPVDVVDANAASPDRIRRILEGASGVIGATARTSGGEPLRRMIDIHYDVPVEKRSLKDKVNRYVFGYRLTAEREGRVRVYRYGGIVQRKGVRWIGQSVLRLPPSVAEEVEAKLRGLGALVTREEVYESY